MLKFDFKTTIKNWNFWSKKFHWLPRFWSILTHTKPKMLIFEAFWISYVSKWPKIWAVNCAMLEKKGIPYIYARWTLGTKERKNWSRSLASYVIALQNICNMQRLRSLTGFFFRSFSLYQIDANLSHFYWKRVGLKHGPSCLFLQILSIFGPRHGQSKIKKIDF